MPHRILFIGIDSREREINKLGAAEEFFFTFIQNTAKKTWVLWTLLHSMQMTDNKLLTLNLHLHTNCFTKWGEKINKIHDSPLSMVIATYNATDDGIPESVSGKIYKNMYLNYRMKVCMSHLLRDALRNKHYDTYERRDICIFAYTSTSTLQAILQIV